MADIFAAVDLTSVAAFIVGAGVVIVGIALSEKGINIGKRNIKKA